MGWGLGRRPWCPSFSSQSRIAGCLLAVGARIHRSFRPCPVRVTGVRTPASGHPTSPLAPDARSCGGCLQSAYYSQNGSAVATLGHNMEMISRFPHPPDTSFFLFGARGTGKSTWTAQAFPGALHLDLLRPDLERELRARPERLRERVHAAKAGATVVIDEVQKIPALLDVVHQLIEEKREWRFVLTGSSARKLRRGGTDLMAGRAILRRMHPFMAAELGAQFSLDRSLRHGLVPIVWTAAMPDEVLAAYIGLYLREEVQMEGLVRRLDAFSRFLEVISFSHGQLLNLSNVARECEVGRKTIEGYQQVLEDLLLGFRVPVFLRRAQRDTVKHDKFYLFDAGVFRSLRPNGPLDRPEEMDGPALEGLVAQHLRAWIDYSADRHDLCYWRTRGGSEVDLVVYGSSVFAALEVKNARRIGPEDLRGLRAFRQDYPESSVVLLYRGDHRLVIDGVLCVPCEEFLRDLRPGSWPLT